MDRHATTLHSYPHADVAHIISTTPRHWWSCSCGQRSREIPPSRDQDAVTAEAAEHERTYNAMLPAPPGYCRARFVDADGRSFFEIISQSSWLGYGVYYRQARYKDDLERDVLTIQREVYQREIWVVPYGPLACGIHDERDGQSVDVVYRYQRTD